jgi:hypothetical protein
MNPDERSERLDLVRSRMYAAPWPYDEDLAFLVELADSFIADEDLLRNAIAALVDE